VFAFYLLSLGVLAAMPAKASRAARYRPGYIIGLTQIGEYLGGVSDDSVRRYIARGDLRGYKLPGSRLIACKISDLDAFVAAGEIRTVQPRGKRSAS
jgi:hypothetical protein